jgi:hypothetical protein
VAFCQLSVFSLKKKEKSGGSFPKFGYFGVLITNCLFLPHKINVGPTGIRTQVARFKVWSDNHYIMEPFDVGESTYCYLSF